MSVVVVVQTEGSAKYILERGLWYIFVVTLQRSPPFLKQEQDKNAHK